ncbi:GspH/FimT family pseudopilin [Pseudomonadota bacterium]
MSNGNGGVTLIELAITLAVLAVTVTVITPSMQQLLHGNRLRTEASRLLDALNLARSEAVIRNTPVALCPAPAPGDQAASCSGRFADGWIVFSDTDSDGLFDAESDELIRAFEPIPSGYSLTNLTGTRAIDGLITYLPDGSSRRNLSLLFCPPQEQPVQPWSVVLNNAGRARMGRGEGQCPGRQE